MNLNLLPLFEAVGRTASFTAAAAELGILPRSRRGDAARPRVSGPLYCRP
jgi:hypothetical protein